MSRRPPHIPQRTPIFVGCEGESEAAYVALLQDLSLANGAHVHVHIEALTPGAGDPLARVERAIARLDRLRGRRTPFAHAFILLDSDQLQLSRDRAERARREADAFGLNMIWQDPCHEALLLRHLEGRTNRRPMTSPLSLQALQRDWPDYHKPMSRHGLRQRLDLAAVRRAGESHPDLSALLAVLGLL
ncbi:RloB domain-containing protein [Brevundimonas sp. SL130]|jgi:hypothetical protein|uniref:RloB domain-containing protein n=1 Tax=Brevundimonas sp. SL130 TaxID=2995143 RepID=UPI003B63B1A2